MTRLEPLLPGDLEPQARRLYDAITQGPRASGPQHFSLTRADGGLNGPFNAFLLNPGLGEALQRLGTAIRYEGTLSPRCREIAILTVATAWNSRFERRAHEAVGRAVGLTDADLDSLRAGAIPELEDEHEGACARLANAMVHGDVPETMWHQDAEFVGAAVVFELATLVGYYATLALQLRVFRVDED